MKTSLTIAALAALLSTTSAAVPAQAHPGEDHAPVPQAVEGDGVVKAVDARAGTIVIAHGPIAALKWPAMTMKFKVESAAVLNGVTVGKTVHFWLKNVGGKPVVSQIHVL
jgi:Cu(I)/Ag(I) efflux system protein CusF